MKSAVVLSALMLATLSHAKSVPDNHALQQALLLAEQQQLDQQITWQRLMYADAQGQSTVRYRGYFLSEEGAQNLKQEMQQDIRALFSLAAPNQSVRCRFPARSHWLMQQLGLSEQQLPAVSCPEFDTWVGQIKPYKATLIYATDFMGNPSSMFGHTLLRLDPKDQKQLNLVSYAVNYAATVNGSDNWSYAWKGLTGQYPGEYSLMPYYRKVKEYGDFESRDLWEYELNLTPEETRFLVEHLWEMQQVSFPYYFVSDNCAYRLLGLLDLVRPDAHLQQQFSYAAIPVETLKAIEAQGLVKNKVYRPALETQLLAQSRQHGRDLAKAAHRVSLAESDALPALLNLYPKADQAKILEMAYDDLYLQFLRRQIDETFAQPRFRQLLGLRSQIELEQQRWEPERPRLDPTQSHKARNISISTGRVQGQTFAELGHRQAYHDLIDPQGGFRSGTQLNFWEGFIQYREDELKLQYFDFLSVNSYNPVTPFRMPLSWGFNFGWQQEALAQGQFSSQQQHGVLNFKTQAGYSLASQTREHLCYVQAQAHVQTGKALDLGWRIGAGPTLGCQNLWSEQVNSLVQVELPYWQDSHQWQLRLNSQLQYVFNQQNALRLGWEYQQQNHQDWHKTSLGYVYFF